MSKSECAALLDRAATYLLAVAYADPFTTDPSVRLPSLWAVELLATVGAAPIRWDPYDPPPAAECLREALATLGQLPIELFADRAVLEAAAAARAAFDAAG